MKKIIILLLVLFINSSLQAQESKLGVGASIGNGYGFNISYKTLTQFDKVIRNELYFLFFTNNWHNSKPMGEEGFFGWLYKIDEGHNYSGYAFGDRLIFKNFGLGISVDLLVKKTWINYYSDVTGLNWHSDMDTEQKIGFGMTSCLSISKTCRLNLYAGTNINWLAGLEFFFF
jgi:hypothetical protein